MVAASDSVASRRRKTPITRLLDRIGSIWFGVTMLILIFTYSSLGSAAPPIRQGAMADWVGLEFLRFEKSEMEWFCWWPFQLMIGLFCLAIITITIRRIPLTRVNAGVWAIHTGIVVLCVCSMIYFGSKVEGDVAVFHSRALIMAPGMVQPASMVVRPEAAIEVAGDKNHYRISVAQMLPGYELQTGPDKGKKTPAIWFNVQSTEPRSFTRVVLVGYPEYTEDVLQGPDGAQRARKVTGRALVDQELQIKLDYDPVVYFYHAQQPPVRSTAAIYARLSAADEWTQIRFEHLPHYYERLSHHDELWTVPGDALPPPRLLDLHESERIGGKVPGEIDVRITDYLPYAELKSRWVNESNVLNPMLRFSLPGADHTFELFAADPQRRRIDFPGMQFRMEFLWAESAEQREAFLRPPSTQPAGEPATRMVFVSGPDDKTVDVALVRNDGTLTRQQAKVGEPVSLLNSAPMMIEELQARAVRDVRPMIVPRGQRQSLQNVGKTTSLVRLEINDGRMLQSVWMPFSQYAFDDDQRAQPSRFLLRPRQVRLADGRVLELLYSRWRDPLPSPVALDRFVLQTYPGGDRPSDYISLVRFFENGEWTPLTEVKSNRPAQHGDLWYFQSQWDPDSQAHTVLGVGNRHGVHGMLAGVCISIAGMIYAFYIKPSIIRRRKQAALIAAHAGNGRMARVGIQAGQEHEVNHAQL